MGLRTSTSCCKMSATSSQQTLLRVTTSSSMGSYSWVPEDTREAILTFCRQNLTPSGAGLHLLLTPSWGGPCDAWCGNPPAFPFSPKGSR